MTTQNHAQQTLTMRPVMSSHDSEVIRPTDPAFRYKVFNEHGAEVAFITNQRASGRPASWEISLILAGRVGIGEGDYETAEDALTALKLISISWLIIDRNLSFYPKDAANDPEVTALLNERDRLLAEQRKTS